MKLYSNKYTLFKLSLKQIQSKNLSDKDQITMVQYISK